MQRLLVRSLLFLLVEQLGISSSISSSTPAEFGILTLKTPRPDNFALEIINRYKKEALNILDKQEDLRRKRYLSVDLVGENTFKNVGNGGYSVPSWKFVGFQGEQHFLVCVGDESLFLLHYQDETFVLKDKFSVESPTLTLQAFSKGDHLWIVAYHYTLDEFFIQLYVYSNGLFQKKQRIKLDQESIVDMVSCKGSYYLLIAPSVEEKHSNLVLYHWKGSQFDSVASTNIRRVSSIVAWDMEGILYIAPCLSNQQMSPLLAYSEALERLYYVQYLEIAVAPIGVRYLYDESHSYLLYSNGKTAEIYLWDGHEFKLWQVLQTSMTGNFKDATMFLSADKEVFLLIISSTSLTFFVRDQTMHFVYTHSYSLPENAATYGNVVFSGPSIYIASFVRDQKLVFEKVPVPPSQISQPMTMDPLSACLLDLRASLQMRTQKINVIKSKLDKVWKLDTPAHIRPSLIVHGSIKFNKGFKFEHAVIESNDTSKYNVHPDDFYDQLNDLEDSLKSLTTEGIVTKSSFQRIDSSVRFLAPIVVQHGDIPNISGDPFLNNLKISRIDEFALKKKGVQTVYSKFTFPSLKVDQLTTDYLNSEPFSDLILLNGSYSVDTFTFVNVTARNVILNEYGTLNNIHLSDLVLSTVTSNIVGTKHFKNFSAETLKVHGLVNNANFSAIAEKTVVLNSTQIIEAPVTFVSPLVVKGNILMRGSLSGMDAIQLSNLAEQSVKKNIPQVLTGRYTFKQAIEVNSCVIKGKLNNVFFDDIMTLSTYQEVHGLFSFGSVEVRGDVECSSINGISLSSEAVSDFSNINGHKIFLNSVEVLSDVVMENGSTIDHVDPSEMKKSVATHEHSEFNNIKFLSDVNVRNLEIDESIPFPLHDLRKKVWLRSTKQKIPSLFTHRFEVEDLNVQRVNYLDFPSSFVPLRGNATIGARKTFNSTTVIQGLISLKKGTRINGMLLPTADEVVFKNAHSNTLLGKITMQNLVVQGSIDISGDLNGVHLWDDCMMSNKFQIISGVTNFEQAESLSLKAEALIPTFIADINFFDFVQNTVMLGFPSVQLSDKFFQKLNGATLFADGAVDGIYLNEFFRRAVTLHGMQNISSPKTFEGSLHFRSLTVNNLNHVPFSSYIQNVVTKDKPQIITGRKIFEGLVQVNNLEVLSINGISLSALQQDAVLNSRPNTINSYIVINNNVTTKFLFLDEERTLDGVKFEELVEVNSNESISTLLNFSNIEVTSNIHFNGLINKCNISKIVENALYLYSPTPQVITGKKSLQNMDVTDLLAKCTINGISIEKLNATIVNASREDDVLTGNFYFENLSVNQLYALKELNNGSMHSLLSDSVRRNNIQIVKGKKVMSTLSVKNLFVYSMNVKYLVNGANFTEISSNAVSKVKHQLIHNRLKFNNMHATNLTVLGQINGIRLPEDVILCNSNDLIEVATFMNATLEIRSDLNVSGRIDDVHLASVLSDVVLLDSNETINSELVFYDDVHITGMASIITINKLPLKNMVTRSGDHLLTGRKTFSEDLVIRGNLDVENGVNGYDIAYLDKQISKIDENEVINEVTFESGLILPSLTVTGNVNGHSISGLWNTMHDKMDTIDNVTSSLMMTVYKYDDILFDLIKSSEDPVQEFAYFEINQQLDLGSTKRFLPIVHGDFSETLEKPAISVIVWTENMKCMNDDCCKRTESVDMKMLKNGTLIEQKRYLGKVYKFALQIPRDGIKGFLLHYKDVGRKQKCKNGNLKKLIMKTCFEDKLKSEKFLKFGNIQLIDAAFVEMEDAYFLVVAYLGLSSNIEPDSGVFIYKYNWTGDAWKEHQFIKSENTVSIALIHLITKDPNIFLAVGHSSIQPSVSIYQWDAIENLFFSTENVSTFVPTSLLWVHNSYDLYLFVANEYINASGDHTMSNVYVNPVQVFKFSDDLVLNQTIDVKGVSSLETFGIVGETYIAAVSRYLQTIYIIQYRGYSGFQVIQTIPAAGVESATTFPSYNGLMLAIASNSGHTKILKAFVRGAVLPESDSDL